MIMLRKLSSFNVADEDMAKIYILYIQSILEQSCQVWHFSISEEEKGDLERVQKVSSRIIFNSRYTEYQEDLEVFNLATLFARRDTLSLKCLKYNQTKDMFPLNTFDAVDVRLREKYHVQHARGSRLLDSTLPQLQRALNEDARK